MMNTLESFLESIAETREVWLLEAMTGLFAMLEDAELLHPRLGVGSGGEAGRRGGLE